MKTGEMGTGAMSHGRWCEGCSAFHGTLYVCEQYPEEVKQAVRDQAERFRSNLADPCWRQEQVQNGVPLEVLAIMDAFMGGGSGKR